MYPQPRKSLGYTRLEIGFGLLLVVLTGLLAVTKFLDLSVLVNGSMEQGVIKAVQKGISTYALESKQREGDSSAYPPVLDDADIGDATSQNLLFVRVLPKGIAVEGWAKTGRYGYRAPSRDNYVYDPHAGTFDVQRSTMDKSLDHSAKGD